MPKIPIDVQMKHIDRFIQEREKYKTYSKVLEKVFKKVADIYAPLGIVQSRAKAINSFSEKIIRKDKYKNPLVDMTDLCGARVITHFTKQVYDVSAFIEENFEVDHENSLDVKTRLKISEFGYRSIHYIVTPKKPEILGISIPEEIRDLKAEIQVRTFHEHIWADILHDRIYKSTLNVTDEWKRESARLAAVLEQTDSIFANMSETIDQLSLNYKPTPAPERFNSEIEILETLISISTQVDENNAKLRLRLATLFNQQDEWKATVETLKPVAESEDLAKIKIYPDVLREYGFALLNLEEKLNRNEKSEGFQFIQKAITYYETDFTKQRALALCNDYLTTVETENRDEFIQKAYKNTPADPYYYTSLLINELLQQCDSKESFIDLHISKMEEAIHECKKHIALGIEVLQAHFVIGKLNFLLGRYTDCIETYLAAMRIVICEECIFSPSLIIKETEQFKKLTQIDAFHANIIESMLHMFLWRKYDTTKSKNHLLKIQNKNRKIEDNVLIVCGKSASLSGAEQELYTAHITEALLDFEGTVISGGTDKGIPGIVGKASYTKKEQNNRKYTSLGYLPKSKKASKNYDDLVTTEAEMYSVWEAIVYWIDILMQGIKPGNCTVLGIHGGFISSCEYKLGLLLGSRVCLIGESGGSAQIVANAQEWNAFDNLLNVPNDSYTLWALIAQDLKGTLTSDEIETLAPQMHEFYRQKRRKSLKPDSETDIDKYRVVMDWDKLPTILQDSNRKQIAFMEQILKRGGLKLQKSGNPKTFPFKEGYKTMDTMARLEHARWNAERLLNGWSFGDKDVLKKKTPYIVSWDELDEDIKTYDYDPIKDFPFLIAKIGYEITEE